MRFCVIGPENSHHFLNQSDARIKSLRAERVKLISEKVGQAGVRY